MDEIERVIRYIQCCRDAGVDVTITIDKSKSHLILNALKKQVSIIVQTDCDSEFKCPECSQRVEVTRRE